MDTFGGDDATGARRYNALMPENRAKDRTRTYVLAGHPVEPPRLAAGLLFTPLAISAGAVAIAHANGLSDAVRSARLASRQCVATAGPGT